MGTCTLFCAPKTKSLHEITRAAGVCVLASWKIQKSAIWRWNCTFILQRMLCVKLLRLRLPALWTRFQSCYPTAFHHCWHFCLWPLLLVRMCPALACSLTKLWLWHRCCQMRVIPLEAEDQLSSAFIFLDQNCVCIYLLLVQLEVFYCASKTDMHCNENFLLNSLNPSPFPLVFNFYAYNRYSSQQLKDKSGRNHWLFGVTPV